MGIAAIISEYNPLHNGHVYHICETKRKTGCDVLALMSGSFVQRGEPAALSKSIRAQNACVAGADIVVQMPVLYSVNTAQIFARGCVKMLTGYPDVEFLSFGAECTDLALLTQLARLFCDETQEYSLALKSRLQEGKSFPAAREEAVKAILGKDCAQILQSPNNILAVEYLCALRASNSSIRPLLIPRIGAGYDEAKPVNAQNIGMTCSASAVRAALSENRLSDFRDSVPQYVFSALEKSSYNAEIYQRLYRLLRMKIRSSEMLNTLCDVGEGLDFKLFDAISNQTSYSDFLASVKSKRYTMSRLKRLCIFALLDITKNAVEKMLSTESYYNILAIRRESEVLLSRLPDCSLTCRKDFDALTPDQRKNAGFDILADDLYSILFDLPTGAFFTAGLKKI